MSISEEFFIERRGVRMILYAGVLQKAHEQGIASIDTELVQAPGPDNGRLAIVKATVEMGDGTRWSGLGDASPESTSSQMVPHLLRLAETRAKARALKDATNIAVVSMEETGGDDAPDAPQTPRTRAEGQGTGAGGGNAQRGSEKPITESQLNYLKRLVDGDMTRLAELASKPPENLTSREASKLIDRMNRG